MKKYTFLVLFFVAFASAQTYEFDRKCTYEPVRLKNNFAEMIWLFNSKSTDFTGRLYSYNGKTNDIFILQDYKNLLKYSFEVNKKGQFSNVRFTNITPDYTEFDVKKITVFQENKDQFKIEVFSDEKTKKPNLKIFVTVEKSDFILPKIRFMDVSQSIHDQIYDALLEKLDSNLYKIKAIKYTYKNGLTLEQKLLSCETVELNFSVQGK